MFRAEKKLERFLRNSKRAASARQPVIEVGFRGRRIAVLAAALEFGNPSTNLPERPAFRNGVGKLPEVVEAWRKSHLQGRDWTHGIVVPDSAYKALAVAARDAIRQSYLDFPGVGLSATQEARKAGSQYADDELVGSEGPKLVSHIRAYVDGQEVN